jgi:hypothetical protein
MFLGGEIKFLIFHADPMLNSGMLLPALQVPLFLSSNRRTRPGARSAGTRLALVLGAGSAGVRAGIVLSQ